MHPRMIRHRLSLSREHSELYSFNRSLDSKNIYNETQDHAMTLAKSCDINSQWARRRDFETHKTASTTIQAMNTPVTQRTHPVLVTQVESYCNREGNKKYWALWKNPDFLQLRNMIYGQADYTYSHHSPQWRFCRMSRFNSQLKTSQTKKYNCQSTWQ